MVRLSKRVDVHVGEKVRERRAMLGLTQQHLAAQLGLSYQQVQKYETGANRISAGRLYELAQMLNVHVSFFFEGLNENEDLPDPVHGGRNRSVIELARNYAEIDDSEVRAAISSLTKSLSERKRGRNGLMDAANDSRTHEVA